MFKNNEVIGLTGGMGSGKSTVSAMLPALGYQIVDADMLTRSVHRNASVCAALVDAFGPQIMDDTALNRRALAQIAFASDQNRLKLNEIMQPALRSEAMAAISRAHGPVILDAPLLFEAHWDDLVHKTVVVLCPYSTRFSRIIARDQLPEAQIHARLSAQVSDEERCRRADFFIYNCGNLPQLHSQVLRLFA